MRAVQMAKPRNDPDHHHFFFFVYQQPSPLVQGTICFSELDYFIKCMHGKGFYSLIYLLGGILLMGVWMKNDIKFFHYIHSHIPPFFHTRTQIIKM